MSYNTIDFEIVEGVACITLNRPEAMNAFSGEMAEELFEAALRCETDAKVRSVFVTGAGEHFSAGGDLKGFVEQGDELPAFVLRMATILHAGIIRLNAMAAPVVMAINGTAAGGGFSFALSGDYSLASDNAKFISAYTASGLTPDASSTYFLAKHVGLYRAKELMLLNRALNAEEALNWGITNRIIAAGELKAEGLKVAQKLAQGPTQAYAGTKALLNSAFLATIETQLEAESCSIAAMMRTEDAPQALDAFLNKKKPIFQGK